MVYGIFNKFLFYFIYFILFYFISVYVILYVVHSAALNYYKA